ncbi:family 78 glycoside hydrolase catalytic domain [Paenibacillus sp. IITD108]|uniref:family 78 glycoside hydrolase catalytic domain n=1 Tax=Paenibacillus sp. IITD108 TaxID=3116649 RepID=UPI002F40C51A
MNSIQLTSLRTEYLINPLGIDSPEPRFSWIIDAPNRRGVMQSAYQIIASSNEAFLHADTGDLWDTGKVLSDISLHVKYEGDPLSSEQQVYWKVRIWDEKNEVTSYSEPAFFSMGLLRRDEWHGCWIGLKSGLRPTRERPNPVVYFRKSLNLQQAVRRATIYATALGVYRIHVNGEKLGRHLFAPEWTDYHVRTQYQTYDATSAFQQSSGEIALSVMLGHGWYTGYLGMYGFQKYGMEPSFFMQCNIEFEDGTGMSVSSDESWKASFGPITASDLQMGETYDANKAMEGWMLPSFEEHTWYPAERMYDYRGKLVAQMVPPVAQTREHSIRSIRQLPNGSWLVDIGQNLTGWLALQLEEEAQQTITLRYAEALDAEGNLYTDNLRLALQTDRFKTAEAGAYQFETAFTCHGFQYVEISGLTKPLTKEQLTCKVVHSNLTETGELTTSNPLINKLFQNILWSQRNNYMSVPTDCPQRDERHGWTGDAQIFARTAAYNMDIASFMTKWMTDLADGQQPTGAYSDFAPFVFGPKTAYNNDFTYTHIGSAGWADAPVIISWLMYEVYGDREILRRHYDSMKRWMDYNDQLYASGIRCDAPQYGDWLSVHERPLEEMKEQYGWLVAENSSTPYDVFSTLYWAYDAQIMIKIASLIGSREEVSHYEALYRKIVAAFHAEFITSDGEIKGDTQTVYAMALDFNLIHNKQLEEKALNRLIRKVTSTGMATTGFHGTRSLMRVLSRYGHDELAFSLLLKESYPSWLYSVVNGATTIWERWDGWTKEKGFQRPGMNSLCHYAFGSVGEWLYEQVGGIRGREAGCRQITIAPKPLGGLTYSKASYGTPYGKVKSEWKLEDNTFHLSVCIPANTRAYIHIPSAYSGQIEENGQPVNNETDCLSLHEASDAEVVYYAGSGIYSFTSKLART